MTKSFIERVSFQQELDLLPGKPAPQEVEVHGIAVNTPQRLGMPGAPRRRNHLPVVRFFHGQNLNFSLKNILFFPSPAQLLQKMIRVAEDNIALILRLRPLWGAWDTHTIACVPPGRENKDPL